MFDFSEHFIEGVTVTFSFLSLIVIFTVTFIWYMFNVFFCLPSMSVFILLENNSYCLLLLNPVWVKFCFSCSWTCYVTIIYIIMNKRESKTKAQSFLKFCFKVLTAWKGSKYGVISGPYLPVFGLNTGKYKPEITPYLGNFHAAAASKKYFRWWLL